MIVYNLFYNHDDNYDITSHIGTFYSVEGAKQHAKDSMWSDEALVWKPHKHIKDAYEATYGKYGDLYYLITADEVQL